MKYSWSFLVGYPFDFLHAMFFRMLAPLYAECRAKAACPWVIGGHRGRIYEDNAAAVHRYVAESTDQKIIWISGNKSLTRELEGKGYKVLRRNSWKARLAMIKAPVVMYSHGEDDIDQFFRYFRKCAGLRLYLNHGHSFTKTGYFAVPAAATWSEKKRRQMQKKVVNFDYMLLGSEYEREMLIMSMPFRSPDAFIANCGCPHVDKFILAARGKPEKRILWFPTFRDDPVDAEQLDRMEIEMLQNAKLRQYLESTGTTFTLVRHINSGKKSFEGIAPCFEIRDIQEIGSILPTAECFISDYSGIIIDWLLFDRPFVRFAFDIERYTRKRSFYIPLDEFVLGKDVKTVDELAEFIASEEWKDRTPYLAKIEFYKNRIFPNLEPTHTEICVAKIRELLHQRQAT
ncbi:MULTISPECIES: CDP-glycerol glycerophosphotransferase family protein [unclassified Fibrobacter]|uniref:CDP-glycerol glycerophosphotransferase family protein n=1 Tax=unclassified Fibrobacter TaxID=2634177 RepID=UPI0025B94E42|nr:MULTISPECIES: CDP-glycerol glycerophosphotransferase family protein [unclassified Fibrobacter]